MLEAAIKSNMNRKETIKTIIIVVIRFVPGFVNYKKGCTRLAAESDKAYQLLAQDR
jgi:hypothetical protein